VRIPLLAAAAVLICLGLVTGCSRTVSGTVAQTTEAGATSTRTTTGTTTSRPSTTTSLPTTSPTGTSSTGTSPTSEVPAPANAKTMKCSEYDKLDENTQAAVIRAILGPGGDEDVAQTLADSLCEFLPNSTVSEVITGTQPT
jgi:hypothetical protein